MEVPSVVIIGDSAEDRPLVAELHDKPRRRKKKKVRKRRTPRSPRAAPQVTPRELSAAIVIQRAYRTRKFRLTVEMLVLLNRKRTKLLQEVLVTERSYVRALGRLKRDFVYPLSKVLSEVEMANVFPAVNEIWKLHEQNLSRLEKLMEEDHGRLMIAELFSELAGKCGSVYSPFLNAFSQASVVLKRLMDGNPRVEAAVNACKPQDGAGPGAGLKYLNDLIITPMQRLPRYEMLFKELCKCSNELYPDYIALNKALSDITKVCQIVNENKREADEKYRRVFLEQHASMQVLREHNFVEKRVKQVHFCAECERSIWGLGKKLVKCVDCGERFHLDCADDVRDEKSCIQRRRLDLRAKQLLDQAEVFLMPEEEARLKNPDGGGGGGGSARTRSGSKLLSQLNSPSMQRITHSPKVGRKKPDMRIRVHALVLLFDDGLGLAHKWMFDDDDRPIIDMIGELPWKAVCLRSLEDAASDCFPFVISSDRKGVASFKFYTKTSLDRANLTKRIDEIKSQQLKLHSQLRQSEKVALEKQKRRSFLMDSSRYKAENQRESPHSPRKK